MRIVLNTAKRRIHVYFKLFVLKCKKFIKGACAPFPCDPVMACISLQKVKIGVMLQVYEKS